MDTPYVITVLYVYLTVYEQMFVLFLTRFSSLVVRPNHFQQ